MQYIWIYYEVLWIEAAVNLLWLFLPKNWVSVVKFKGNDQILEWLPTFLSFFSVLFCCLLACLFMYSFIHVRVCVCCSGWWWWFFCLFCFFWGGQVFSLECFSFVWFLFGFLSFLCFCCCFVWDLFAFVLGFYCLFVLEILINSLLYAIGKKSSAGTIWEWRS